MSNGHAHQSSEFFKLKPMDIQAMPPQTDLYWLPEIADWRRQVMELPTDPTDAFDAGVRLANGRLNFTMTNALDQRVRMAVGGNHPKNALGQPIRLAILASCTTGHLHAAIRVAGLRRKLWIETYETDYGLYVQALMDPNSDLAAFRPTHVLFAFDAVHLTRGISAALNGEEANRVLRETVEQLRELWTVARARFGCVVFQQGVINSLTEVLGQNEQCLPGSRRRMITELNGLLYAAAREEGIDLVAVDRYVELDGLAAWHNRANWHRTKQDVVPTAAPKYGDLVCRLVTARRGLSSKCAVLDLDNTLWGGVIGDDGIGGIVLGQGSGSGEGFVAFQQYLLELSRRGIILAVCSKNDEKNAREPFERHPEMVLKSEHIVVFRANWNDKAHNIRDIATILNIGIDSIVFVDDNPFERELVRRELPMVAVPEFANDPADMPQLLADAGYFEAVTITEEDRARSQLYRANTEREAIKASTTDVGAYLRSLNMKLLWGQIDIVNLQRSVQLINKTNQFNLTTRRYSEDEVQRMLNDPRYFGIQLRLIDSFGDNGIISVIIGCKNDLDVRIDTWLMSCRVLGRGVERATLNVVADLAIGLGAKRLIGEYIPTVKNSMVADHYRNLGFEVTVEEPNGVSLAVLELDSFVPVETFIEARQVSYG
ncbi:HAD-IIIC family phosphatase [Nitrospirillum sp. BR 11752]|uniref:HAD-IIIC family phosphatase n=1 Tax=Nitrospirillum sp. BR 11752 TaxID=3104293 RepID=UPI002EBE7F4D|nr:HAD-IIIC family phosphatase [Nitrospirillum sp. BR 11752]